MIDEYDQQQSYAQPPRSEQDPNSIYADYMREEKVKNLFEQLNPEIIIENIEHRIRGEKKDSFTEEWVSISKDGKQKKISELLISNYISFLSSILNNNTTMSNFNVKQVNNLMDLIIDHVKNDLADNAEEYGFVYVNEIVVEVNVKQLLRKTLPNGKTAVVLINKPSKQKKIIEETTDYNEMNRIGMIICNSTFSVFNRALNGAEARRTFAALRVQESLNQQPQKKGFWDALKVWS